MMRTGRDRPYYSLRQVYGLIHSGDYIIDEESARQPAKDDFGWDSKDIKAAILKLRAKHFHKSAEHYTITGIKVDYYKARGLMGEDVYIHFHIEDGQLIIASFKRI